MEKLTQEIQDLLIGMFPDGYVNIHHSTNLGNSIVIRLSKEKQKDWQNGIFMNSTHSLCHVWNVTDKGQVLMNRETGMYGFEYNTGTLRPRNKKVSLNSQILLAHIKKEFSKF